VREGKKDESQHKRGGVKKERTGGLARAPTKTAAIFKIFNCSHLLRAGAKGRTAGLKKKKKKKEHSTGGGGGG